MDKKMRFTIGPNDVCKAQAPSEVKLAYEIARELVTLDKTLEYEADPRGLIIWIPENGIVTNTFIKYMERVTNYYQIGYYISTDLNGQMYVRVCD